MTKLTNNKALLRETLAVSRGKAFVVELGPHSLAIRPKGARWRYEIDYRSIFELGARKEADRTRLERAMKRRGKA